MEPPRDALVILDAFQDLLLVLLAHPRQGAQLAFRRELRHSIYVAYLERVPDESDGLRPESLDLQQIEHAGTELREQLRVQSQLAFRCDLADVRRHPFPDARDREQLLLVAD